MDSYEATKTVFSRIQAMDPDNASKIMGYLLLQDQGDNEMIRLAFGPESLLHSLILQAKSHLGLPISPTTTNSSSSSSSASTPSSAPAPAFPRPSALSMSRISGGFEKLTVNPSSPSANSWQLLSPSHGGGNNNNSSPSASSSLSYAVNGGGNGPVSGGIITSPNSGHFGNVSGGDCSSSSNGADALDDYPFDEYLSFLDDSRNDEFVDPESDAGLHRRRFSESDAEDGGFGNGYRPSSLNSRVLVGSPREIESFYLKQREGMMRLKAVHQQQQQRLVYNKYMNYLLQQNDPQSRLGVAAGADDFHKYGRFCPERNEIFAMSMAEKANSAARQIYLTFPADSTFKDEDVSNYFSTFGPVEDVRIPYQQKRMFGFVTFLHAETVKLILARGNPHFICDSRVLVKPYKEKGKALNEQQHHMHHQLMDRGNFSPCSSPSGLDGRELYDLPIGPRMPYNSQEVMMRRKLEEQAELQQAIELQGRRLVNLQLPDLRGDYMQHHQMPTYSPHNQNTGKSAFESEPITEAVENSAVDATAKQNSQTDVEPPCHIIDKEEDTNPDSTDMTNCHESSFEHGVHDASSHTNPSENQDLDGPIASTEMAGSSSLEDNDAPVPSTSL
ncbi:Zinc finger CCCH domain-containing protein 55 [Linum perenne]